MVEKKKSRWEPLPREEKKITQTHKIEREEHPLEIDKERPLTLSEIESMPKNHFQKLVKIQTNKVALEYLNLWKSGLNKVKHIQF